MFYIFNLQPGILFRPLAKYFVNLLIFGMFVMVLLFSCQSTPILDEESPNLYFKAADMARFQRKRLLAIDLYKLLQLRFADNFTIVLEAEFSIAQIYFSWPGHDSKAELHYRNVVEFYQRPEIGTDIFPMSYLNLALKNLEAIARRKKVRFLPPKTDGVRTVTSANTRLK